MSKPKKSPLLQGSLDLLILQSLKGNPMHGYAISRHLKEVSKEYLQVEEGSLYPALHRLEHRSLIKSWWGASETNRRAKFYELTNEGLKQLRAEAKSWRNMSTAIEQVLNFQN
jgi:PadR family transcriptional regulator, regulatory protein PadR